MRKLVLIDAKRIELQQGGIDHWTEEALLSMQDQGATRLAKRRLRDNVILPEVQVTDLLKTPTASHYIDATSAIED